MWTPIVNQAEPVGMTVPQLADFVAQMQFTSWRPSGMVLHNTAAPTLAQWHSVPGTERITNLVSYFRDQRCWSAGPHAFVADDLIWPFTPFNRPGVHSPSWNGTKLGIEMVGDFSVENADQGPGLKVMQNTVALFGILHARLGLDPDTIKFHKEDPQTTHNCPGAHILKPQFIALVKEYMGEGGEHPTSFPIRLTIPNATIQTGAVKADSLNVREHASVNSAIVKSLMHGAQVVICGEAMNGNTKWLHISKPVTGWVAAHFVEQKG